MVKDARKSLCVCVCVCGGVSRTSGYCLERSHIPGPLKSNRNAFSTGGGPWSAALPCAARAGPGRPRSPYSLPGRLCPPPVLSPLPTGRVWEAAGRAGPQHGSGNLRPTTREQKSSGFLPQGQCGRASDRRGPGPGGRRPLRAALCSPAGRWPPVRPPPPLEVPGDSAAPRPPRARRPATGPTHLLPTGRPGSGLVRLAGPAPTAGPRRGPRPSRRGARPATLARRPRAATATQRRLQTASPGPAREGEQKPGISRWPRGRGEQPRPAPPAAAILYHSTRSGARGGGHLRGLRSAAAPLTFTENSAAATAAASSGSGRRGQGREGEGERKTKKGKGRGRKESRMA